MHGFLNASHVITLAMSFFNRPLKTYLPIQKECTSPLNGIVLKNQNEKYKRIKEYSGKTRNAKELTLNIEKNIIMKRGGIAKKQDSKI